MKRWLCTLLVIVMGMSVGAAALAESQTFEVGTELLTAVDDALAGASLDEIVANQTACALFCVAMLEDFAGYYDSPEEAAAVFDVDSAIENGAYIGVSHELNTVFAIFFEKDGILIMGYLRDDRRCAASPGKFDASLSRLKSASEAGIEGMTDSYVFVTSEEMVEVSEALAE